MKLFLFQVIFVAPKCDAPFEYYLRFIRNSSGVILFNYSIACRICTAPCKICTTSFTSNTILHDLPPFCMILHYFRCKLRTILHDLLQFYTILHYLWCINFFVQFAQILKNLKNFCNFCHGFHLFKKFYVIMPA